MERSEWKKKNVRDVQKMVGIEILKGVGGCGVGQGVSGGGSRGEEV